MDSEKTSLYDLVGGEATLERVHRIFYDKVYAHPWLKLFFENNDQTAIEKRQTSFMAEKMGGPARYMGKAPKMAHRHMYITRELFDLRQELLHQSLVEAGVEAALAQRWLKIDSAFHRQICKDSIESFYKTTWKYEKRQIFPKPAQM